MKEKQEQNTKNTNENKQDKPGEELRRRAERGN